MPSSKKAAASAAQAAQRERFRRAHEYASKVLTDPLARAVYARLGRERGKPSNILLASNYLNPPEIQLVDVDGYHGGVGEPIRVAAYDAIEVVAVRVSIRTGDGQPVESGDATSDHGVWTYRTTAAVPAGTSWQVEIVASNRAEQTDRVVRIHPLA